MYYFVFNEDAKEKRNAKDARGRRPSQTRKVAWRKIKQRKPKRELLAA